MDANAAAWDKRFKVMILLSDAGPGARQRGDDARLFSDAQADLPTHDAEA